jgi:hypothetical protein
MIKMKKLFLFILISINSVFFVKADSSQEIPTDDPVVNSYVDIGTSIGIGIDNYKKNKKEIIGWSFGINKSFVKGKTDSCGVAKSNGGKYFCYTGVAGLQSVKYEVSNDFFLNLGMQTKNANELGLLFGSDTYKPNPTIFKTETALAFGLYFKHYYANNFSFKIGFLTSNIDQVRALGDTYKIRKTDGAEEKLNYSRIEFTTGYRF